MKKMTIFRRNSFRGVSVREREREEFFGEKEKERGKRKVFMHYLFGVYKGEKMAGTTNRGEDHMESLPLSFYPEASISSEERKPGCLLPLDSFLREFLRDSVICMLPAPRIQRWKG